jgi:hypoxanthine phosphoribosyltransferase
MDLGVRGQLASGGSWPDIMPNVHCINMSNKIYLSNEDFNLLAVNLRDQILPIKDRIEWIVGIGRGGLPLSNWLASELNKRHAEIYISFRDRALSTSEDAEDVSQYDEFIHHPFLLVDDIVDSGRTMAHFKEITRRHEPKYWTAALHWCPENSPNCKPDYYVATKKISEWIVYPWEPQNA